MKNCSQELFTALKRPERKLVYFLRTKGVFGDDTLEEILVSLKDPETSDKLMQLIKDRVYLDPQMFHELVAWFKKEGELYAPIVRILEAEFARQQHSETPIQQGTCNCNCFVEFRRQRSISPSTPCRGYITKHSFFSCNSCSYLQILMKECKLIQSLPYCAM